MKKSQISRKPLRFDVDELKDRVEDLESDVRILRKELLRLKMAMVKYLGVEEQELAS